jgi:RNA polymerase sigma-70 factor (ECF subfamily)
MDASETEQIKTALNGDPDSFEMLIRTHSRTLFAVAFAVLQDRDEAEDVVQETFVRAWRKRTNLRETEKFPAWITAMARNRACDLLRKRRTVPLDDDGPEIPDPLAVKPDDQMAGADLRGHVQSALARLPEPHRTALTLRYLDGLDHHAIEEIMGLTNGALRGILGRALAAMRKTLKPTIAAYE